MKKSIQIVFLFLSTLSIQAACAATVINIEKSERTDSALVLYGTAKPLPAGTKIWATVQKINGSRLNDSTALQDNNVTVDKEGHYKAILKRRGNVPSYSPPDGAYQIEFYAIFNRAWQEVPVLKAVGAKLDAQGIAIDSEPHSLPSSPDLIKQNVLGDKVRVLKTIRTIKVDSKPSESSQAKLLNTKKATVEINDWAKDKPVKSFDGTQLTVKKALTKAGHAANGRAISIVCHGDFKDGLGYRYIANDLIFSDGRTNREFNVNGYTTIMDVCAMQEEAYANKRRKMNLRMQK